MSLPRCAQNRRHAVSVSHRIDAADEQDEGIRYVRRIKPQERLPANLHS